MEKITLWDNSNNSIVEKVMDMPEWRVLRTKPLRFKWNWAKLRWMYTITLYKT